MRRLSAPIAAMALVTATPSIAAAQDWNTGVMDPAAMSSHMSLEAAAEAQARQSSRARDKSAGGLSASAAATCRNKHRAAKNMGRDHPKVKQLYRLCAQAGY